MNLRAKIKKVDRPVNPWRVDLTFCRIRVRTEFFPDFDSALEFAISGTSR